jgi:outer membrane receptor for ferrienterochelin and colicins
MADQSNFYAKVKNRSSRIGLHQFLYGVDAKLNYYKDNSLVHVSSNETFLPGVFIEDEITFSPKLITGIGLRTEYNTAHGFITSPRLHIRYNLAPFNTMRFGFGQGFRVVNIFTEDHAALSSSRIIILKEDLKPERSYNFTLSYTRALSIGSVASTLDLDLFYSHFTNKIIPDYNSIPASIVYANGAGNGIGRGVSLGISSSFNIPLSCYVGASVQDVFSIADGPKTPELFSPLYTGVSRISYKVKVLKTSFEYSLNVTGPMELPRYPAPFSRSEMSSPFFIHNLQATTDFKQVGFFVAVKNISGYIQDSPLIDPANPFGNNFDTSYAYGPLIGRRFVVGFKYKIN